MTFVIWGLLHGLAVAFVHLARRASGNRKPARWGGVLITFHFVTVAWVFFRAPDLATAGTVLSLPFTASWHDLPTFFARNGFLVALLAVFFCPHRFDDHRRVGVLTRRLPAEILWPLLLFFWLLAFAVSQGTTAEFIYFEF